MTRQEAFDKAFAGLLGQRTLSKKRLRCVYAPREGVHCAIGWLIPEDTGRRWDELKAPGLSAVVTEEDCPAFIREDLRFYEKMQEAHDTAVDWHDAIDAMRKLAKAYDLEVSE